MINKKAMVALVLLLSFAVGVSADEWTYLPNRDMEIWSRTGTYQGAGDGAWLETSHTWVRPTTQTGYVDALGYGEFDVRTMMPAGARVIETEKLCDGWTRYWYDAPALEFRSEPATLDNGRLQAEYGQDWQLPDVDLPYGPGYDGALSGATVLSQQWVNQAYPVSQGVGNMYCYMGAGYCAEQAYLAGLGW